MLVYGKDRCSRERLRRLYFVLDLWQTVWYVV